VIATTTVVIRSSGTDPATIILAALGVALALESLVWQARTFFVSGSRRGRKSVVGVDVAFDEGGSVEMTTLNPPLPFRAKHSQTRGFSMSRK
jgi:hypothetical protein